MKAFAQTDRTNVPLTLSLAGGMGLPPAGELDPLLRAGKLDAVVTCIMRHLLAQWPAFDAQHQGTDVNAHAGSWSVRISGKRLQTTWSTTLCLVRGMDNQLFLDPTAPTSVHPSKEPPKDPAKLRAAIQHDAELLVGVMSLAYDIATHAKRRPLRRS